MNRKSNGPLFMIILLVITMFLGLPNLVNSEGSPISVKAILPENQFNKNVSYFHLMMKPGQKQDIEVELFNTEEKDVTAEVTLTSATTNDNGLIDYSLPDKEIDPSNLYPFSKIAKTPKEVIVPAKKSIKTKISIEMPVETYDGMILGGINIKSKKDESKKVKEKKAGGMQIENEMNYAIGVVLVENENPVKTNMELERVFANQIMGNNTTKVTLRNPTTAVIENLTIEGKVYKKGSDQVLYETKKENYRMAPTSSFDFGIPIGNERYKPGEYRLKLIATSDPKDIKDGEKQTWEFDEEFSISKKTADKLNEKAVDLPKSYTSYIIAGIIILIVILIIIILLSIYVKKSRQTNKKNRKRKSSKKQSSKKRSR